MGLYVNTVFTQLSIKSWLFKVLTLAPTTAEILKHILSRMRYSNININFIYIYIKIHRPREGAIIPTWKRDIYQTILREKQSIQVLVHSARFVMQSSSEVLSPFASFRIKKIIEKDREQKKPHQ